MLKELLRECEREREKIIRNRKTNAVKGFQEYLDGKEKRIKAKEEIIKILCGIDGMTPAAAGGILDDTKELITTVAMQQPIEKTERQESPSVTEKSLVNEYLQTMERYTKGGENRT